MHRSKILKAVGDRIGSTRNKTHGDPQENLSLATALKETLRGGSTYLGLSAAEREAADQICTKLSRLVCGSKALDHWEDIAGYAAIAAESRSRIGEDKDEEKYFTNLERDNMVDTPIARKVRR